MATKTTTTTTDLNKKIEETKLKLVSTRLDIRSGKNKNTNAHKPFKKQLAQLLTQAKSQTI